MANPESQNIGVGTSLRAALVVISFLISILIGFVGYWVSDNHAQIAALMDINSKQWIELKRISEFISETRVRQSTVIDDIQELKGRVHEMEMDRDHRSRNHPER